MNIIAFYLSVLLPSGPSCVASSLDCMPQSPTTSPGVVFTFPALLHISDWSSPRALGELRPLAPLTGGRRGHLCCWTERPATGLCPHPVDGLTDPGVDPGQFGACNVEL